MAWAQVQGTNTFTASTTTPSLAFASPPATGNTLIFVVVSGNTADTFSGMNDTYVNAWTNLFSWQASASNHCATAWACVNKGGSGTNTCSLTASGASACTVVVFEFSGGPSTVQQDGTFVNAIATASPITTPTFNASVANDLLIAIGVATGSTTFNAPWAAGQVSSDGNGASYILNAASGNTSANFSDSATVGSDASAIAGLKIGGAVVTPAFQPRRMPLGV